QTLTRSPTGGRVRESRIEWQPDLRCEWLGGRRRIRRGTAESRQAHICGAYFGAHRDVEGSGACDPSALRSGRRIPREVRIPRPSDLPRRKLAEHPRPPRPCRARDIACPPIHVEIREERECDCFLRLAVKKLLFEPADADGRDQLAN